MSDEVSPSPVSANVMPPKRPSLVGRFAAAMKTRKSFLASLSVTERASISTARATWAIALFSLATILVGVFQYVTLGRQLSVMQGQLEAMLRDEQPRLKVLSQIMPGPTFQLMNGSQDTGYAVWNVPYINAGKGAVVDLRIDTYISLGGRPYVHSNADVRPDPVHADDLQPQTPNFLTIFSQPIPKTQYDTLAATERGISIYVDFSYVDELGNHYHGANCFGRLANGAIANLAASECKKRMGIN